MLVDKINLGVYEVVILFYLCKQKHKGIPARFLKKPLANLALLRSLYSGSFATSKYSYSPGCESGKSLLGEGDGNDTEETGDSDDCFENRIRRGKV